MVKYVLSSPWDSEKRNFDLFVCLVYVKKLTIKLTLTLTLTLIQPKKEERWEMGDTVEPKTAIVNYVLSGCISIHLLVGGLGGCRRTRSCLVIQGLFSEDDVKNKSKVSAAAWKKHSSG